jgi:hypothetical protein
MLEMLNDFLVGIAIIYGLFLVSQLSRVSSKKQKSRVNAGSIHVGNG